LVALDTNIDDELKEKGVVRDLIREIQDRRKELGFVMGEMKDMDFAVAGDLFEIAERNKDELEQVTNTKLSLKKK